MENQNKPKKGGKRPGAGRPRRAERFATPIFDAESKIRDRLPQLLENLFKLADGIQTVTDSGVVGYTLAPCRQSNEYLINRVMGKPIDRKEVSGPEGNAIPVAIETAIAKIYGD